MTVLLEGRKLSKRYRSDGRGVEVLKDLDISVSRGEMVAIVGASGGIFGVMMAFAWFWPRDRIYIWGVLPIEARWLVVLTTIFAIWSHGRTGETDDGRFMLGQGVRDLAEADSENVVMVKANYWIGL